MAFGIGDLLLIFIIVVVVFGAKKLPLFGAGAEATSSKPSRWTWADWVLLAAAVLSVSVAIALEISKHRSM
jgi:hypothetical protein